MVTAKKKTLKPGPEPDHLKVNQDWRDAIKKALERKRPPGGFPKPKKQRSR